MSSHDRQEIDRLCRLIPGYDPWRDAGEQWYLDYVRAQAALLFFETEIKHVEGEAAGKPFILEDWQKGFIINLIAWRGLDDKGRNVRRYRKVFLFVPRGNGKTPLIAALVLLLLWYDGEIGAQCYCVAGDRDQATTLFRHAAGMVEQNETFRDSSRTFAGQSFKGALSIVLNGDVNSFLRVMSSDKKVGHGKMPHVVAIDELHCVEDYATIDALQTAMAKLNRPKPVYVAITTAGDRTDTPCHEEYKTACKVRDGDVIDPRYLPIIYEAPLDADWTDPETWRIANPNLGVTVSEESLRQMVEEAKTLTRKENAFRTYHLNQWLDNQSKWLSIKAWDECEDDEWPDLARQPCWCGLDMATVQDVAAFVAVFRVNDLFYIVPKFWVPEAGAVERSRQDKVPYLDWIRAGHMKATTAFATTDYSEIRRDINEFGKRHKIKELAVDRWNATQLIQNLTDDGFTAFPFGQGYASMSAPCQEFERLILERRLRHSGNPVLRWMIKNAIVDQDAAGNLKPNKEKSADKIDGVVATIMALGRAIAAGTPRESPYLKRGLLAI